MAILSFCFVAVTSHSFAKAKGQDRKGAGVQDFFAPSRTDKKGNHTVHRSVTIRLATGWFQTLK